MSAATRTYPRPAMSVESAPFWQATGEGKLMVGRCNACSEYHYYPRAVCPHCLTTNVKWVASSGKGTIYSFSIMRRAPVPYAIAYVTLEEGVTMMTNIVDCDFDALAVGQDVTLVFGKTEGDVALPLFRPA